MQEVAITYFVVVYLVNMFIGLAVIVITEPLRAVPVVELVVVALALVVIIRSLAKRGWLWNA